MNFNLEIEEEELEEQDNNYGIRSINSNLSNSTSELNSLNNSLYSINSSSSSSSQEITPIQSNILSLESLSNNNQINLNQEGLLKHLQEQLVEEKEEDDDVNNSSTTPIQHSLAQFLRSNLSPPTSPSSFSSLNSSPIPKSIRSDKSESGSGEEGGGGRSELVMPFLDLQYHSRGVKEEGEGDDEEEEESRVKEEFKLPIKLLIFGSNEQNRKKLGALLSTNSHQSIVNHSESDLSSSFLTNLYSDSSRNSSNGGCSSNKPKDLGNLVELDCNTSTASFYTLARGSTTKQLFQQLLLPLEKTDAILNPSYPSTERLLEFVSKGTESNGDGTVDACLMLFSSPPLASEVATARTISKLLPIFPILLLPPSPKPQKTAALLEAVDKQLKSAGVHYTPALLENGSGNRRIYCLPNDLFEERSNYATSSSGTSSLASSQELLPPSIHQLPTTTSTFSGTTTSTSSASSPGLFVQSQSQYRDLTLLRLLASTPSARDRIKRIKVLSFLEWREINLAAKGMKLVDIERLPSTWNEIEIGVAITRGNEKELEFSKRVGERRGEIEIRRKEILLEEQSCLKVESVPEFGFSSSSSSSFLPTFKQEKSSYFSPPLPSPSISSPDPTLQSYTLPPNSSLDPFHIPSLLHLVGLNLRLTLLPPLSISSSNNSSSNHHQIKAGTTAVLMWGVVSCAFVVGLFCGRGGNLLLWREV